MMIDRSEAFALAQDASDVLAPFRSEFLIPPAAAAFDPKRASSATPDSSRAVYLTGNSLGLQPRATRAAIEQELSDWSTLGVEGHLHAAHPWLPYHQELREDAAALVGAKPHEVVVMNSLTVNLHLLMTAFYRPTAARHAIMIEDSAFPSDSHAMQSQIIHHGFDAARSLIRLKPRAGEHTLRTDDILGETERHKGSLALVLLGGVNYLTGQWFDMPAITAAGHRAGAVVGWDLAHAAGNVPLALHDINADFACWCSYKYLNSGPGAIAGAFVHERHVARRDLPQFAGWWGNDPATRFVMGPEFVPIASADRFQLSNPPIFSMTPVRVSLELFRRAGMDRLRAKSLRLTAYMESLIDDLNSRRGGGAGTAAVQIVTPRDPAQRGCQLSLLINAGERAGGGPPDGVAVKAAHDRIASQGVIVDFRSPNIIRAAPAPLYNTFHDVWSFVSALERSIENSSTGKNLTHPTA
ncbi:MAG: kynureninase [Phycisphaerales bacterium]|nr:kynureninase [Phycisphaerales bacterium]